MRLASILLAVVWLTGAAVAQPDSPRRRAFPGGPATPTPPAPRALDAPRRPGAPGQKSTRPMLTAAEVERDFARYRPEVERCVDRHARRPLLLEIELIIWPDGAVMKLTATPSTGPGARLQRCLRARAAAWRFSDRSGFTVTTLRMRFDAR